MISHDKKCIFVHIPKCAGSSINQELRLKSFGFSGHSPASCHSEFLSDYFSFTFIRNPYDRVVSAYKYFRKLKEGHRWYKRNKIISDAANKMSFIEFVNHVKDFQKLMTREEGSFESGIHFQPFYYFLDEPIEYIGRFENIQHDYFNIMSRLNLPLKNLPKTNSTNNSNYRELYIEESKNTVYNIYKEDIKKYNYQF
jgi:chondroitin 4-sulfotransferase 11